MRYICISQNKGNYLTTDALNGYVINYIQLVRLIALHGEKDK